MVYFCKNDKHRMKLHLTNKEYNIICNNEIHSFKNKEKKTDSSRLCGPLVEE